MGAMQSCVDMPVGCFVHLLSPHIASLYATLGIPAVAILASCLVAVVVVVLLCIVCQCLFLRSAMKHIRLGMMDDAEDHEIKQARCLQILFTVLCTILFAFVFLLAAFFGAQFGYVAVKETMAYAGVSVPDLPYFYSASASANNERNVKEGEMETRVGYWTSSAATILETEVVVGSVQYVNLSLGSVPTVIATQVLESSIGMDSVGVDNSTYASSIQWTRIYWEADLDPVTFTGPATHNFGMDQLDLDTLSTGSRTVTLVSGISIPIDIPLKGHCCGGTPPYASSIDLCCNSHVEVNASVSHCADDQWTWWCNEASPMPAGWNNCSECDGIAVLKGCSIVFNLAAVVENASNVVQQPVVWCDAGATWYYDTDPWVTNGSTSEMPFLVRVRDVNDPEFVYASDDAVRFGDLMGGAGVPSWMDLAAWWTVTVICVFLILAFLCMCFCCFVCSCCPGKDTDEYRDYDMRNSGYRSESGPSVISDISSEDQPYTPNYSQGRRSDDSFSGGSGDDFSGDDYF